MEVEKNYDVYFEVYGKKMKATVMASNEEDAKDRVIKKVIFHKVSIKRNDAFNTVMDQIQDIYDALNIK